VQLQEDCETVRLPVPGENARCTVQKPKVGNWYGHAHLYRDTIHYSIGEI